LIEAIVVEALLLIDWCDWHGPALTFDHRQQGPNAYGA
jgi:hypothetical protein